jgi:hypothetical protein
MDVVESPLQGDVEGFHREQEVEGGWRATAI